MRFFLTICIFISVQTLAQNGDPTLITGSISDEAKNPVLFGNVSIHDPQDSTLLTGGVSDAEGKFQIPVKAGT
jgi:hypothetical protein